MNRSEINFETPQVLYDKYQKVQMLGWNASRIGLFLNSYLLLGLPKDRKRPALIDERSFQALIKFANSVMDAHKIDYKAEEYGFIDLMTPTEFIEEYPQIKRLGWTSTKVGIFLACKLLVGYQQGVGRSCLITRKSFLRLVEHANGTIDRRKIILFG